MDEQLPHKEKPQKKINRALDAHDEVLRNHKKCCGCGAPIGSMHLFINLVINGQRIRGEHCNRCAREVLEKHIKGGNDVNDRKDSGEKVGHQLLRGLVEGLESDVPGEENQGSPVPSGRRTATGKKKSS